MSGHEVHRYLEKRDDVAPVGTPKKKKTRRKTGKPKAKKRAREASPSLGGAADSGEDVAAEPDSKKAKAGSVMHSVGSGAHFRSKVHQWSCCNMTMLGVHYEMEYYADFSMGVGIVFQPTTGSTSCCTFDRKCTHW